MELVGDIKLYTTNWNVGLFINHGVDMMVTNNPTGSDVLIHRVSQMNHVLVREHASASNSSIYCTTQLLHPAGIFPTHSLRETHQDSINSFVWHFVQTIKSRLTMSLMIFTTATFQFICHFN